MPHYASDVVDARGASETASPKSSASESLLSDDLKEVEFVDTYIGGLLDDLRARGLYDDTLMLEGTFLPGDYRLQVNDVAVDFHVD